ncbi:Exonuclease VII small subunit [Methanococcus vannielii SB]|uniref:Exonuclease VII small subunit n=1 Tax=Methanococcus vannielii (strain ATCC 35089 / DSM 1224 / JCM 13029 / OCM 148 / SB) TaxID=406327 RepID=A6USM2_METVS|nr:exodeoxyribonuclease VII small subunit [Methanococcus vannielii]ABR55494.1 Exonuclease VII small subunit [Methanococcus vannielii SB]
MEKYEDLIENLENIVNLMENEELSLEEAMKNYEKGIILCNKLYKMLNEADGKIKILSKSFEVDFLDE